MEERGIIFNGDMVRAILDGRKTQTRRPIKPQPPTGWGGTSNTYALAAHCPFGVVGDRLWVKEGWRVGAWNENTGCVAVDYRTDGYCRAEWIEIPDDDGDIFNTYWVQSTDDAEKVFGRQECYSWKIGESPCRWRPSIHMPRWASRITLEITGVRVERLQEITEEDARAEGVDMDVPKAPHVPGMGATHPSAVFSDLWDSIYAKRGFGWDSNPWVWVIEFRRVNQ